MKKQFFTIMILLCSIIGNSQTIKDLFLSSDVKVSWLGIDFSHVKLIGDFSEFGEAGSKNTAQIRDQYFTGWNNLVLAEPQKYDIKGMLREGDINNDIEMVMDINAKTNLKDMESYNTPKYSKDNIKEFVHEYDLKNKEGIGVLFIAECLNKNAEEAIFHFVAINMHTGEILLQERLSGKPKGFGLRNYWAGALYSIIKDIKTKEYIKWKNEYVKN